MLIKVCDWHTDGYPSNEEVHKYCGLGKGKDCCSWLAFGTRWECMFRHKHPSILQRRADNSMVAMKDGCDPVRNLEVTGLFGEYSFNMNDGSVVKLETEDE